MSRGVFVQKLKCLLPNDVSLANLNRSGSVAGTNIQECMARVTYNTNTVCMYDVHKLNKIMYVINVGR